jgi:hypothetical protein
MQPIVWLEHVIPANATYTVLFGPQGEIPLLCVFWLQPRRFVPDVNDAAWVVTFYQALPPGLRYTRKVFFNPGIYAVEVKR